MGACWSNLISYWFPSYRAGYIPIPQSDQTSKSPMKNFNTSFNGEQQKKTQPSQVIHNSSE